ncbi:MAG: hypothetical protein AB9846_14925 [Tenuifilaceae bacterium]
MTNEEQILAAIEEISNQLNDIKKTINRPANNAAIDLSPISNKLDSMKENLQKLGYASISRESEFNRITESLRDLRNILNVKQNEVLHRYIEVKQPHKWIIGTVIFFVLSISACFFLINWNIGLKNTIETIQPNSYKYRYLKLKGFDFSNLRSEITNTNQLVYYIDLFYKENSQELENYVIKREEELRQIFEASEVAKQKEVEARMAKEKAESLKQKIK